MIVEIKQVKANGANLFTVFEKDTALFTAKTPWMNLSLPFGLENLRKLYLYDIKGNPVFWLETEAAAGQLSGIIPEDYPTAGLKNNYCFSIMDSAGCSGAIFSDSTNRFSDKMLIAYKNRILELYKVAKGKTNTVSVYLEDIQIAQITKPLATENNLDSYFLHIAPEFDFLLPVLCLYTVCFDYMNYPYSGQVVHESARVSVHYTYSKSNKFYNPDWITSTFGREEQAALTSIIEADRKRVLGIIKKRLKLIGILFLAVAVLLAVMLFIFYKKGILG